MCDEANERIKALEQRVTLLESKAFCDHTWAAHSYGPYDCAIAVCTKCGQKGGEHV